jgi:hypothetical protein
MAWRSDIGVVNGTGRRLELPRVDQQEAEEGNVALVVDDDEPDLVDGSRFALKVGGRRVERKVPESQVIHHIFLPSSMPAATNLCMMP